jgi:hypothetical protein
VIFDDDDLKMVSDLALQFEAISNMSKNEQSIIKQLLEGMIIKSEAERWSSRVR